MGRVWHERGQYGNIVKHLISSQLNQYQREKDRIKKTKIAQNIGYLIQVQSGLINSEKNIEERIMRLEEITSVAKESAT